MTVPDADRKGNDFDVVNDFHRYTQNDPTRIPTAEEWSASRLKAEREAEDRKWQRGGANDLKARAILALFILVLVPVGRIVWEEMTSREPDVKVSETQTKVSPNRISNWRPHAPVSKADPALQDLTSIWKNLQTTGPEESLDGSVRSDARTQFVLPEEVKKLSGSVKKTGTTE